METVDVYAVYTVSDSEESETVLTNADIVRAAAIYVSRYGDYAVSITLIESGQITSSRCAVCGKKSVK